MMLKKTAIHLIFALLSLLIACAPGGQEGSGMPQIEATPKPSDTHEVQAEEPTTAAEREARSTSGRSGVLLEPLLEDEEAEPSTEPSFSTAECPFEEPAGYGVRCGYLTVPENRSIQGATMIQLAVAILPSSTGSGNLVDPIIYLEGGPGGSALYSLETDFEGWVQYGFLAERSLIFIDQRGTGYSMPDLNCEEHDNPNTASWLESEIAALCYERLLGEGIDLSAYNTAENGADIADLATALGLESYNLFGVSYGTRLALAVMRDHPDRIRSVVLDSPFPPNADPAEEETVLTYDRMQALFDACAADYFCNRTFPGLEDIFLETVYQLNLDPAPNDLDGDYLTSVVQQGLFSAEEYLFLLPLMIYDSFEGDYDLLQALGDELLGANYSRTERWSAGAQTGTDLALNDGDSEGMYYSVMCRDEFAFASYTEAEIEALETVPLEVLDGIFLSTVQLFNVCDLWEVGSAGPEENRQVTSDIPTLILVGQFDPSTPPVWGRLTAAGLSNGQLYEIPGAGHSLSSGNPCAIELMDQFFENPTQALDDSCVWEIGPVEFELN